MKKIITIALFLCSISLIFAQTPKNVNYKKQNDFMVAVLNNNTFSIYDLIKVSGLHEKNTQFLDEYSYTKSSFIVNRCKELYGQYNEQLFHNIYRKVSAAWTVFKEVQDCDLSYNGMGKYFVKHDMFDTDAPQSCPYPELKHKLSIIPLKLEVY